MKRALLLALVVLASAAGAARAEDAPAGAEGIAWFTDLTSAREAAAKTGRPIFMALHVRPRVASPTATQRTTSWLKAYADPKVVALSRELACVLRIISATEGRDPDSDPGAPAAEHLVMNADGVVLARLDGNLPEVPAAVALLLRRGLHRHGPIPAAAPRAAPAARAASRRNLDGASPMRPIAMPATSPGVRLHLRWALPAPALRGTGAKVVKAQVHMRFDEQGPWHVGALRFEPGDTIDVPVDIRFDAHEGLVELATKGLHRVDLYLVPEKDSYPFSRGPLHIGHVWINLGDGGGGGGGGESEKPDEKPDPKKDEKKKPAPDEKGEPPEPPPPPEKAKDDVVNPFVGEGDAVKKEDAVVAVEDDDAGVKPPRQVPLAQALREFEKQREKEIRRDGLDPHERAFLRRYFEILRKNAEASSESAKKAGR